MLELSNPCVFMFLGSLDRVSLTSGALLGLLVGLGVKMRRKAGALLLGLGSTLVTGMFLLSSVPATQDSQVQIKPSLGAG